MTTSPLFKRVPVEATEEMLKAAFDQANEHLLSGAGNLHCKTDEERSAHAVRPLYRAMLAASPEPPAESAWRTIESAPAGVEVLVCGIGSAGYYVALAKKIDGHWMMFCSEDDDFTLLSSGHSHWQPLPAPPALSNKG